MEKGRSSSTIETTEAKVKSIFVYPIKSCCGISLSQAPLTPTEGAIQHLLSTNHHLDCNQKDLAPSEHQLSPGL
ncbi:hypothetical protein LguiA_007042 [Lonicera macranthoides]